MTLDNLTPILAAFRKYGYHKSVRKFLYKTILRFSFSPNIDRDYYKESRKYPWPHNHAEFENGKKVYRFSWFAMPDPILWPDDWWHIILCARFYPLYILAPITWLFLVLKILVLKLFPPTEVNQWIAKVEIAGPFFKKLFKKCVPDWETRVRTYFGGWRDQSDIAEIIIKGFK